MWWVLHTWAAVTVDDPSGCIDAGRLENELGLLLTEAELAELDIGVTVAAVGEQRAAAIQVEQGQTQLWSRELRLTQSDCPSAAEAAALSIHQGLATLPGWSVATERPRRVMGGIDLAVTSSADLDARFTLGGGVDLRIVQRTWLWSRIRAGGGTPLTVGAGRATVLFGGLALGLRGSFPVRKNGLELLAGVDVGLRAALGLGFDINQSNVVQRFDVELGAGWLFAGPLRIGVVTTFPVLLIELIEEGGDRRLEPPFRIGLSAGLRL